MHVANVDRAVETPTTAKTLINTTQAVILIGDVTIFLETHFNLVENVEKDRHHGEQPYPISDQIVNLRHFFSSPSRDIHIYI